MSIYWEPIEDNIDPDTIDVYDDGTLLGTVDVSNVSGMPDDIGGLAPNAVRELVETELNKSPYEADRRMDYVDMRDNKNPHL